MKMKAETLGFLVLIPKCGVEDFSYLQVILKANRMSENEI